MRTQRAPAFQTSSPVGTLATARTALLPAHSEPSHQPNSQRPYSSSPGFARAFSLLEVVVAMTILAMITGTLFTIIRGSVKGAADIEKLQRENDQVNRFIELVRVTLQTLPVSGTLALTPADQAASGQPELTIAGMPTCFGFGMNPISYKDTILGLRPDLVRPNNDEGVPRFIVSISREDIIPQTTDTALTVQQEASAENGADEQGRFWLPLLPNVSALSWRFFKESSDEWLEEWSATTLPDLIEMNLTLDERTLPIRMVFAPPVQQLQPPSAATKPKDAKPTTTSTAPSTSTSSGGGNNGGGGNNNGGQGRDGGGRGGPGGDRGGSPGGGRDGGGSNNGNGGGGGR